MNALNENADKDIEKTITIHYETTGEKPTSNPNITVGKAHVEGTVGKAFANGDNGLKHDEKNALRSEYGQPELTVYPNGEYEITDTPTISDLPKGTVIYNEEQTEKILSEKPQVSGNAYADGTVGGGKILTTDNEGYEPYDPDKDDSYFGQLYKAWNKYYGNIDRNVEDIQKTLSHHITMEHNQQMHETINQISRSSSVINTKNIQPVVNVGDINITCPGVRDPEVMRNIHKLVQDEFFGIYEEAYQLSMRSR